MFSLATKTITLLQSNRYNRRLPSPFWAGNYPDSPVWPLLPWPQPRTLWGKTVLIGTQCKKKNVFMARLEQIKVLNLQSLWGKNVFFKCSFQLKKTSAFFKKQGKKNSFRNKTTRNITETLKGLSPHKKILGAEGAYAATFRRLWKTSSESDERSVPPKRRNVVVRAETYKRNNIKNVRRKEVAY